jgi:TolB-like protein/DNA-binding winged helix-turn-helix (wHTH) protein
MRFQFGECILDADRRELWRGGKAVHVEPQVFDLLLHLIKNRDHVISKDELLANVWQGRIVSDSTLSNRINAARQAIGDSGEQQQFIRTVARRGLRFIGEVGEPRSGQQHSEFAETGATAAKLRTDPGERPSNHVGPPWPENESRPASKSPALPPPDKPSIAVLAFTNRSGDPEQEHFAEGMAEDIITALSRNHLLFVIARNSSFTYKGRAVEVNQVGSELGVRYVLEGSVRKAGNRVRITGQLIDAGTGTHLWAERYDRDLSDIFALQDEITASVAMAIGPAVAQAERERVARKPPENLDAWETYHRGLWHFLKQTPAENDLAKPFFQRAIELDPNFAPGYHGLALAHGWDANPYAIRPVAECVGLMRELSRKAVSLDDADAIGHYVLGTAFLLGGDPEGGRAELERAVSLDPNNAWAMAALGVTYGFYKRPREGLALMERALRASPHDSLTWFWLHWMAMTHYFAGDYGAALETADRVIRRQPEQGFGYRVRAASLGQLGRIEEAKAALDRAMQFRDFDLFVRTRQAHWSVGNYLHQLNGLHKAGLPEQ